MRDPVLNCLVLTILKFYQTNKNKINIIRKLQMSQNSPEIVKILLNHYYMIEI